MTLRVVASGNGHRAPDPGRRRAGPSIALDKPEWRSWRVKDRAARCIKWIERYCVIPSGYNAGKLMRLHDFQKEIVESFLAKDVRSACLQICRGNAKSTLIAAMALWAVSDDEDSPQVPVIAHDSRHAERTLLRPMFSMIQRHDALGERLVMRTSGNASRIESYWNTGLLIPLPADADRLQGLNPSIAIADEAQTVSVDVFRTMAMGAGKRPNGLVLAMGTPGPDHETALHELRRLHMAGGPGIWIEYSAPEDCDVFDKDAWRLANPALGAGILNMAVLEDEAAHVALDAPGALQAFRMYRLGHWVSGMAGWLPPGAWDECPHAEPPRDGTPIVLGVDGTFKRSSAVVAATSDGAVFLLWAQESATDDEVAAVVDMARAKWEVLEVAHFPRVRPELFRTLEESGLRMYAWNGRVVEETTSANELFRAVIERRIAHDHHPLLTEHMGNVSARITSDGLRLSRPVEAGRWIDAAMAARMAWWRATQTDYGAPLILEVGA